MSISSIVVFFVSNLIILNASDVTELIFGEKPVLGIPAAFGDVNSDELTDLFVITNNRTTVQVFLATREGHLTDSDFPSCVLPYPIVSLVPGDFDGDAFMDVLVMTKSNNKEFDLNLNGYVLWGNLTSLSCTQFPLIHSHGQPLAVDVNNDFIIDLFGEHHSSNRVIWLGNANRTFEEVPFTRLCHTMKPGKIRHPHSNAYVDLNGDSIADLFITSGADDNKLFEIWYGSNNGTFICGKILSPPEKKIGQSLFVDLEQSGRLDHVLPVGDNMLYVFAFDKWIRLPIDLQYNANVACKWLQGESNSKYHLTEAATLRTGDFNMDGYPDLVASLSCTDEKTRTVLFENAECSSCDANYTRTFHIVWDAFLDSKLANGSTPTRVVAGAFFDLFQDGVMDVLLVTFTNSTGSDVFTIKAFKNNIDYDANFIKITVLSGLYNELVPTIVTPFGKRKRTFGSNVPGPIVAYRTLDQEGRARAGISGQLAQSAHFALPLPYATFALGRTPNFVEAIVVGVAGRRREWAQLIPNSQLLVIPAPLDDPARWKVQLFVTPSKVVVHVGVALIVTCCLIIIVIALLHYLERRADLRDRQQDSLRFHFDAM